MEDIRNIASILDDMIEKSLVKKPIKKAFKFNLTFDPINPVVMTPGSDYYCPYSMAPEGGYLPYTPEYWATLGKEMDGYRENRKLYIDAGHYRKSFKSLSDSIDGYIRKHEVNE